MDVVSLDSRRAASQADPMVCSCGSHWFDLVMPGGVAGAVTLTTGGSVTGYAGIPICRQCKDNDV